MGNCLGRKKENNETKNEENNKNNNVNSPSKDEEQDDQSFSRGNVGGRVGQSVRFFQNLEENKENKSNLTSTDDDEHQFKRTNTQNRGGKVRQSLRFLKDLETGDSKEKKHAFTSKDLWVTKEEEEAKRNKRQVELTEEKTSVKTARPPERHRKSTFFNTSIIIQDEPINKEKEFAEFALFAESTEMLTVLQSFSEIRTTLGLKPDDSSFLTVFPALREKLRNRIAPKYARLLQHLEFKASQSEYGGNKVAEGSRVVVLGAGPCGLRLALEAQLLGARTTVLESRTTMIRNNVLKLWPFVMEDLKKLGAKQLYQKLGQGGINHISIWMFQIILLKIALLLGVEVKAGETFREVVEPTDEKGWVVVSEKKMEGGVVRREQEADMVFGATGTKVLLKGFQMRTPDTKLAIAITANWSVKGTAEEKKVKEIAGISYQNHMDFFKALENTHGIDLENIVHFQDETHYFVMTAKKECLIKKGVILKDTEDRASLLLSTNIDQQKLKQFAMEAATFSTGHFSSPLPCSLQDLHKDISIFDFSQLQSSKNSCRVMQRRGRRLVLGLVGDSLQQPFWPEGLGIKRGFLSVLDTAWLVRELCEGQAQEQKKKQEQDQEQGQEQGQEQEQERVLAAIKERERLYCLQRTADNNLNPEHSKWSIDPRTRYPGNAVTKELRREDTMELFDTAEEN